MKWERGDSKGSTDVLYQEEDNKLPFDSEYECPCTMYINKSDGSVRPKLVTLTLKRFEKGRKNKVYGKLRVDVAPFYGLGSVANISKEMETGRSKAPLLHASFSFSVQGNEESANEADMNDVSFVGRVEPRIPIASWDVSEVVPIPSDRSSTHRKKKHRKHKNTNEEIIEGEKEEETSKKSVKRVRKNKSKEKENEIIEKKEEAPQSIWRKEGVKEEDKESNKKKGTKKKVRKIKKKEAEEVNEIEDKEERKESENEEVSEKSNEEEKMKHIEEEKQRAEEEEKQKKEEEERKRIEEEEKQKAEEEERIHSEQKKAEKEERRRKKEEERKRIEEEENQKAEEEERKRIEEEERIHAEQKKEEEERINAEQKKEEKRRKKKEKKQKAEEEMKRIEEEEKQKAEEEERKRIEEEEERIHAEQKKEEEEKKRIEEEERIHAERKKEERRRKPIEEEEEAKRKAEEERKRIEEEEEKQKAEEEAKRKEEEERKRIEEEEKQKAEEEERNRIEKEEEAKRKAEEEEEKQKAEEEAKRKEEEEERKRIEEEAKRKAEEEEAHDKEEESESQDSSTSSASSDSSDPAERQSFEPTMHLSPQVLFHRVLTTSWPSVTTLPMFSSDFKSTQYVFPIFASILESEILLPNNEHFESTLVVFVEAYPQLPNATTTDKFITIIILIQLINYYSPIKKFDQSKTNRFLNELYKIYYSLLNEIVSPLLKRSELVINRFSTAAFDNETLLTDFKEIMNMNNETISNLPKTLNEYITDLFIKEFDVNSSNKLLSNPERFNFDNSILWNTFTSILENDLRINLNILRQIISCLVLINNVADKPELILDIAPSLTPEEVAFLIKNFKPDEKYNKKLNEKKFLRFYKLKEVNNPKHLEVKDKQIFQIQKFEAENWCVINKDEKCLTYYWFLPKYAMELMYS
ncbi:hypothetical protein GPJ56_002122 [Histomonas meleagridis]|uniref:uncharacterized protein n=1 Tax=Histomonas meleagridis TaxID=135588 RepID=UPI00355AC268|nr:hypothetical protein GPJ56_002122 [Histomonas meleagridis]KAH0806701.1 hypothetical protein GO595_000552 [Histomonas meleagridis]